MNKKVIVAAVLLLVLVTVFAACKNKEKYTYRDVDGVSVTEDENGDLFVTNTDGDKISITTEDGFFEDDIRDLFTATTTSAVPNKPDKPKPDNGKKPTEGTTEATKENSTATSRPEPSTNGKDETKPTATKPVPTNNPDFDIGGKGSGGKLSWNDF